LSGFSGGRWLVVWLCFFLWFGGRFVGSEEVLVVVRSGGWCSELISPEKRRKNEEAFGGGCTENMRVKKNS